MNKMMIIAGLILTCTAQASIECSVDGIKNNAMVGERDSLTVKIKSQEPTNYDRAGGTIGSIQTTGVGSGSLKMPSRGLELQVRGSIMMPATRNPQLGPEKLIEYKLISNTGAVIEGSAESEFYIVFTPTPKGVSHTVTCSYTAD